VPSTNFTVALPAGGGVIGTVTVTPSDGGGGGTFAPTTVNLTTGAPSATFTYTPASTGAKTISVTNSGGLTNPGNLSYAAALADGTPVSTWPDSSVNGNNATQSGSARPTFKTNIVNSKPVVRFTSAGLNSLNLTTPISGNWPWCVFVVGIPATPASTMVVLSSGATFHPVSLYYYGGGNTFWSDRTEYKSIGTVLGTAFHVVTTNAPASGSLAAYLDGTVITTGGGSPNPNTNNFTTIGSGSTGPVIYSDGDIAEIIIYNVVLSGTDRANIEKYLGTKYGITVAGGSAVQPDTVTGLMGWWKADSLG
jgi:hypothetical protein